MSYCFMAVTIAPLISAEALKARISELSHEIRADFGGEDLHFIGVLKGAVSV